MYTEITKEDFEKALSEAGKWTIVNDPRASEKIYLLEDPSGFQIKIFSSIVGGQSRGVGEDAIRVVAWDNIAQLPIQVSKARVYRVENWAINLKGRLNNVMLLLKEIKRCKKCGASLVQRVNGHTKEVFWGCLNFRNHTNGNNSSGSNGNNNNSSKNGNNENNHVNYKPINTTRTEQVVGTVDSSLPRVQYIPKCLPPVPAEAGETTKMSDTTLPVSAIPPLTFSPISAPSTTSALPVPVVIPTVPASENGNKKIPNIYQQAVFDFILYSRGHCVVIACAGSGKTWTIEQATKLIPSYMSVLFLAFNKDIVAVLKKIAPKNVDVLTFHGLGFRSCAYAYGTIEKVTHKQRKIIDMLFQDKTIIEELRNSCPEPEMLDDMIYDAKEVVNKLCSHIKGSLLPVVEENIISLLDKYGIDTQVDTKLLTRLTLAAVELARLNTREVNFDDMVWLPIVNNLHLKKYDFIFIDETQDANKANLELVLRSLKPNGRVIAVGDPNQSLYGFRGADTEAMPYITARLKAKTLPLSITYRCPKSHVRLAQKFVPEIQAAPDAPEGILENINMEKFYETVGQGDMVLCRYNAPLVKVAFELLSRGIKATIRGHEIGESLVTIIKTKVRPLNLQDFHAKLELWLDAEIKRCESEDKSIELARDKYSVLKFLAAECKSVEDIIQKIRTIFSEDIAAVYLSSIHKAKGLEARKIYIIDPSLMPSVYAKKDWEKEQEEHCQYVAYTRSKMEMYLVQVEVEGESNE